MNNALIIYPNRIAATENTFYSSLRSQYDNVKKCDLRTLSVNNIRGISYKTVYLFDITEGDIPEYLHEALVYALYRVKGEFKRIDSRDLPVHSVAYIFRTYRDIEELETRISITDGYRVYKYCLEHDIRLIGGNSFERVFLINMTEADLPEHYRDTLKLYLLSNNGEFQTITLNEEAHND